MVCLVLGSFWGVGMPVPGPFWGGGSYAWYTHQEGTPPWECTPSRKVHPPEGNPPENTPPGTDV